MNPFDKIEDILNYSGKEAERTCSSEVHTEHLLLGILHRNDQMLNRIFRDFGINVDVLRATLDESQRPTEEQQEKMSRRDSQYIDYDCDTNDVIRNSVTEAARLCHQTFAEVKPEHLLLAILRNKNSAPAQLLITQGLTYDKLYEYIEQDMQRESESETQRVDEISDDNTPQTDIMANGEMPDEGTVDVIDSEEPNDLLDSDQEPEGLDAKRPSNATGNCFNASKKAPKSSTPVLDKFSYDYTKAAAEGALDPVVGRDQEIRRVMEILGRRKKNNPVLIGEPGVGKSAIVEGIAQLMQKDRDSGSLYGKRLVGLDLTAIVAGTKFRGQFEERIQAILKELSSHSDIILFIDEIHTIIGAGSAEGTMDVANILKPALARGVLQCIGATTLDEYRKSIEKDGALERRFQKVIVEPTSVEDTIHILHNIKGGYEKYHHVTYSDEAIEACVKLSERYVNDRYFPDKAIDVLDEVGSRVHINNSRLPDSILLLEEQLAAIVKMKKQAVATQNFEMAAQCRDQQIMLEDKIEKAKASWMSDESQERVSVTAEMVAQVVSRMTGIPVQQMTESETSRLKDMAGRLQAKVVGQNEAVGKVVKAIQRSRLGLRDPNQPIGVFMFLGPTGVGKTYLAKKLAEEIFGSADSLIRIDMSEFAENFNTSRLVGAPPGYVGYNEGGQLTEKVRRKPYSIVLLDEIEKAGSKVFNLLLQVLDEGRLTDGNGRFIDFRNTIIIMTSNTGTRQLKDFGRGVGFQSSGMSGEQLLSEEDKQYARSVIQKSLAKQFAPEFLNRLDEIITFDQLDVDAIKRIVDLEVSPLAHRLEDLGYSLQVSDKAKEFVAAKGYDVQFGARPLKRAVQTYLEDAVCQLMLGDQLAKGDTISVGKHARKDELVLRIVK